MIVISPRNITRRTHDDGGKSGPLHARLMLPTYRPLELEVLSGDPESGAVSWPQLVGLVGAYTT